MNEYYAITETYISLVVYLVLHQIFVIAGDFVEAFSIPAINIGIYVDKLSSVRALLMTIADVFEWAVTQEALSDPGNTRTLAGSKPSERRILSVLSFFGMLVTRCYYLWVIYNSRNKAYVVFITLSVEGFWFGLFQMGFFAIGPEYNAFTSFALHVSGNFVLFFQEVLDSMSHSRPHWNSLFRVRVHAWIAVVSSTLAWPLWTYFCKDYVQGAGEQSSFSKLVTQLATKVNEKLTQADATSLKNLLNEANSEINALLKAEFGIDQTAGLSYSGTNEVTVQIGSVGTYSGEAKVKVINKGTDCSTAGTDIKITVKGDKLKTNSQAKRIAWKLGSALSDQKVKDAATTYEVCPPAEIKANWQNSLSALCMFPLGAFTEDFMYPGLLPYAFLDPQNANLINYTMPLFYMTGAVFVLLVNDVFHPTGFAKDSNLDSWFKDWSEGESPEGWSYHYMWLLHL